MMNNKMVNLIKLIADNHNTRLSYSVILGIADHYSLIRCRNFCHNVLWDITNHFFTTGDYNLKTFFNIIKQHRLVFKVL